MYKDRDPDGQLCRWPPEPGPLDMMCVVKEQTVLEAICSLSTAPALQAGSSWHPGTCARAGHEDRPRWGAVTGGRWDGGLLTLGLSLT